MNNITIIGLFFNYYINYNNKLKNTNTNAEK